jgi:DNA repair protein RecN (Recombination protein N)
MLKQLSIKNYILIPELELNFNNGFTAITGETGAGKSILIGALSLILGKRADTAVLLVKDKKCIIEGVFSSDSEEVQDFFLQNDLDYDHQLVLRREITASGKSRAFINDTPVKLSLMKELGERLVDIHSQHESLVLGESGFQLALVDNFSGNLPLLQEYSEAFELYAQLNEELDRLVLQEAEIRAEEDYIRFRHEEIIRFELKDTELQDLEEELEILTHAEEIKSRLYNAVQILNLPENGLLDKLNDLITSTGKISSYHKETAELNERMKSCNIEMNDISNSLEKIEANINFDPQKLETVSERLDAINSLLQKHHVKDIASLLAIATELGEKLNMIDSLDDQIKGLEKEVGLAKTSLLKLAESLRERRKLNIGLIEKEITNTLQQLGMDEAVVKINMMAIEAFSPRGMDKVEFQFSANKGVVPDAISRIASGGELSRLMLAMKSLITRKNLLPTIILDEIDMGVSGEIAGRVGNLLTSMANTMQLIAITHLPQIAGKAKEHFKVYKKHADDRTVSGVQRLSEKERVDEIASMLSNENVSQAAKATAKELLGLQAD